MRRQQDRVSPSTANLPATFCPSSHDGSNYNANRRKQKVLTDELTDLTYEYELLDVDVAPTAPTSPPTRTQEPRPPPGWGNAECGFYMLRHAPMLTGA
jgi:hypothetical protein